MASGHSAPGLMSPSLEALREQILAHRPGQNKPGGGLMKTLREMARNTGTCWLILAACTAAIVQAATAQTAAQHRSSHRGALAKLGTPNTAEQPKFKGMFEPVNYNQDLTLLDAFFVNSDEGWVSGAAGTILHTTDGGKTWSAQLGGDPQAKAPDIKRLFFLDRRHGWAQAYGLLYRTTDGENWQQINDGVNAEDVVFLTPLRGFYGYGGNIYETRDGGATWKQVFVCATQTIIKGLTKQVTCDVEAFHFPSARVGYGVGNSSGTTGGGVVVKTEDGGATWRVIFIPPESGNQEMFRVFFLDDDHGFILRATGLYRTNDGGRSWQGVPASVGYNTPLKFADPEVAWAMSPVLAMPAGQLTYTADGGSHWITRDIQFPAQPRGFSLPRRDTAYVVGEHGMVYRYRVVPADYSVAHMVPAPLMPGFDSTVPNEVATLNDVVEKLRARLPVVAASGGLPTNQSGSAGTASSGFQQDTSSATAAAGGYLDSCCGALMQQLDSTTNSFVLQAPGFAQRFRNLNLIMDGLNFLKSVVSQANALKQSVQALRQAPNAQAASLALNNVQSQVNGISSSGGFVQDVSMPGHP